MTQATRPSDRGREALRRSLRTYGAGPHHVGERG